MWIDTHGIIKNKKCDSLDEIANILKNKLGATKVIVDKKKDLSDGSFIRFKYKDEDRKLFVMNSENYSDYPELKLNTPYIWLSLWLWGSSVEIIKGIVEEFGGFIDENDCDDNGYYTVTKKSK